ncbi:hypothetical protein [Nesterenkonia sphaerica]|uniref:LysM domain-containing protein n=1 Tax=Nesterenkonia sphaerica TaxID=1804988 RepID=A0A5R9A5E4_9MICC|nr:hypothetical protein [Nesterenkonia sphaerica]TLP73275.1 hypothetical protein FEF27_10240 [Nesterenkonia sphaerica]
MPPFVPERPSVSAPRHQGLPSRHREEATRTVAGEVTLWTLVAEHLGGDATDWEIAREWPRWHQFNIDRIGQEPGSLRPGTALRVPPPPRY